DIGDRPYHHARTLRQLQGLAFCNGGVVETVIRQHADVGLLDVHTRRSSGSCEFFRYSGARAISAFTRVFDALWRANPESRRKCRAGIRIPGPALRAVPE